MKNLGLFNEMVSGNAEQNSFDLGQQMSQCWTVGQIVSALT
jgi:hypothetical protein